MGAAYSQDAGKIKMLLVDANGDIAIALDKGVANAVGSGQCPTAGVNYYGENSAGTPAFKSVLLAAKAVQEVITVTAQGCESGGL